MVAPTSAFQGINWSWSRALLGLLVGLPAALMAVHDEQVGLALAIGVMPATAAALAPRRSGRILTVMIGAVSGTCLTLGAILAQVPLAAVLGILVLSVVTALWATRGTSGMLAMGLGLPMVGIGLSFSGIGEAVGLAALMVLGSVWAWLISLLWPESDAPPSSAQRLPLPLAVTYGLLLGAAGATAAAIGFAADLEHVGWATAAALMVMRPGRDALVLRSIGRGASVVVGSALGVLFMTTEPGPLPTAVAVLAALVALSATEPSRWYVAPMFTTFIVFVLLLHNSQDEAAQRWGERVTETLLGVGLALFFGAVVPAGLRHRQRARPPRPTSSR